MTGVLILKGERQSLFFGISIRWKSYEQSSGERETDDKSNDLFDVKHRKIAARTLRNLGQFGNSMKVSMDFQIVAGLLDSKRRGWRKRKA